MGRSVHEENAIVDRAPHSSDLERLSRLYDEQLILLDQERIARCENRRGLREATGDLLEAAFIELAAALEPELSVEVGAHEASFSARLKARLPGLHALAFEANPYVYERFAAEMRGPGAGVDYRFAAICAHDGVAEFRIPKTLVGDAVERRNEIGSLRHWAGIVDFETVNVPALTLDTALSANAGARSVIWIDAEGAQSEILAGGGEFFRRVAAVYIELEDRERWHGQSLSGEVAERLAAASLVPVMRDNLARGQFNEVYCRTEPEILGTALQPVANYVGALRRLAAAG
jgi:FkbM family methyltransferase